jgi:ATP-dependent Clp protease adaptor protein ClpS
MSRVDQETMLRTAQGRLDPSGGRSVVTSGSTGDRRGASPASALRTAKYGVQAVGRSPEERALSGLAQGRQRPTVSSGPPGFGSGDNQSGTAIVTKTKPRTKRPNLYRVLLLNDDYTPMEFVVHVLERFFNKNREDATRIMLHVHQNGVGECGVFTYEVAETKVTQVMDFARKHQHPLQCVMEKK